MKYLLVLTVVFVAIWVWRNNRRSERAEAPPARPPQTPAGHRLVLGQVHAALGAGDHAGGHGRRGLYCCHEHRRQCEEG